MMKTTAKFTVIHGSLPEVHYRIIKQFARHIPADFCLNRSQTPDTALVQLEVALKDVGIRDRTVTDRKIYLSVRQQISLTDLVCWFHFEKGMLRDRIEALRIDLFDQIASFVRAQVDEAAPPMPPEPEPMYVQTNIRICGQKLAFESTRTDKYDQDIQRKLEKAWEAFVQTLNRTD